MFGIGFGEMLVIAVVLILAVGPESMPKLFKAVGKGLREFRRASRELRNTIGIDEMMREEELKELKELRELGRKRLHDPLGLKETFRKDAWDEGQKQVLAPARDGLSDEDRAREYPPEGVDRHPAAPAPGPDGERT